MRLKGIEAENFENYKDPALFLAFPKCDFKCCREVGSTICQNSALANEPDIEIGVDTIVNLFMNNPITRAIVCGGLEPFESCADLVELIRKLRQKTLAPVIIYTGYTEEEIHSIEYTDDISKKNVFNILNNIENIIIKFGRFIPNMDKHFDEVLGVNLASPNQYAKQIGVEI